MLKRQVIAVAVLATSALAAYAGPSVESDILLYGEPNPVADPAPTAPGVKGPQVAVDVWLHGEPNLILDTPVAKGAVRKAQAAADERADASWYRSTGGVPL